MQSLTHREILKQCRGFFFSFFLCMSGIAIRSVGIRIVFVSCSLKNVIGSYNMQTRNHSSCLKLERERERERDIEREMFYLTTHSTHFVCGYIASDIWLRTILVERKETRCRHIGYSYRLTAWVLLCAPSHRQDSTYHGLCYTSHGALAGTRNSWMSSSVLR